MTIRMFSLVALTAALASAQPKVLALPGKSPLVTFRISFRTGAAVDPKGKEGVANLTAALLAEGGNATMTSRQILDAFYPMATGVGYTVDKQFTTFTATTHTDNLEEFYKIFKGMLLEPGWREDDFRRQRDDAVNFIKVNIRGNNDEELGKEVLYNLIYKDHPYAHYNVGAVSALEKLTIADLKQFYASNYTQANLIIGIAGGYPSSFIEKVKKDFGKLPKGRPTDLVLPQPKPIEATTVTLVKKQTRSVAYSLGYPINVVRGHQDYIPLLIAQTWLGKHRSSGGRLYERMRQVRGLNYGDYAYIEYFPRGMFLMQPEPNIPREQQIFQIWIRPLETPTALFGLRLGIYELNRLVEKGLTQEDFDETRNFLSKYVNLLTADKSAELGYALDSIFYGTGKYTEYIKQGLARTTLKDVNAAIKKHLRADRIQIVAVLQDAEGLRDKLLSGEPSPMKYNSPKPDEIMSEDKVVERYAIPLKPEQIKIVPVEEVFQ